MSNSPTHRGSNGRFTAGNPGRPKGAANKANLQVVQATLDGVYADMLAFLRTHYPEAYASLAIHVLMRSGTAADKRRIRAAVAEISARNGQPVHAGINGPKSSV